MGSLLLEPDRLGAILVRRKGLKIYQLEYLIELQAAYRAMNREIKIGELLVQHRVLTALQIEEGLELQKEMPKESVTDVIAGLEFGGGDLIPIE